MNTMEGETGERGTTKDLVSPGTWNTIADVSSFNKRYPSTEKEKEKKQDMRETKREKKLDENAHSNTPELIICTRKVTSADSVSEPTAPKLTMTSTSFSSLPEKTSAFHCAKKRKK